MSSRKPKWKFRLKHIIESINRIEQYTEGFNLEQFTCDPKTFDAVVRNLIVIGEAARQVPQEIINAYPKLPWTEMRALRNVLTHEYDRVGVGIIWDTIRNDLPPLTPALELILQRAEE